MSHRTSWAAEAGARSRQRYHDLHGHWPEERAATMPTQKVTLRLTMEQYGALLNEAKAQGMTLAEFAHAKLFSK
ncbi:MAG: hypothetical protein F4205_18115 [Gemmatimonadetes bacterium]|nr:hypothetical protein [Gemmatimonadota bacterium]MYG37390.1 hypothetical protein [Gemmatimonadota bacterium]